MKPIFLLTLLCTITMIPLAACSGTLRVEPDPFDPKLHGQVIRFTVPVVYMQFNEDDKKDFDQKSLSTGRLLIRKEAGHTLFDDKKTHIIEPIPQTMTFTITESYWVRLDWFSREFAPDSDMVILKDDKGTFSVTFRSVLIDTNKSELGKNDRR